MAAVVLAVLGCAGAAVAVQSPLYAAVAAGPDALPEIWRLVDAAQGDIEAGDSETGETPLMAACVRAPLSVVRLLLARGARVDQADAAGETPLAKACGAGRGDVGVALLEAGARLGEVAAQETGQACLGKVLHAAAMGGNLTAVQQLLEAGVPPDTRDPGDGTPLMRACYWTQARVVAYLLAQGANPTAVDRDGFTVLHWAAFGGNWRIIRTILDRVGPLSVPQYLLAALRLFTDGDYEGVRTLRWPELLLDPEPSASAARRELQSAAAAAAADREAAGVPVPFERLGPAEVAGRLGAWGLGGARLTQAIESSGVGGARLLAVMEQEDEFAALVPDSAIREVLRTQAEIVAARERVRAHVPAGVADGHGAAGRGAEARDL
eukprot:TRINITY_DN915_c0_g1_i1.p2 TRINITY_DN915_c0_g1~~TRINITY_DN915_c0_g1_i1.p2  ORF type:complete len:380 (-),score=100.59 TRINITY_DN915_c0_g1_i1:37-1176(-)